MSNFRGRDAPGHFLKLPRGAYHKLSLREKQGLVRGEERERPVACPECDTQTTPRDLVKHLNEWCSGPREPTNASAWVSWRQAIDLGVSGSLLSWWAKQGKVRVKGEVQDRLYLQRDVALGIASLRRRKSKFFDRSLPGSASRSRLRRRRR